MSESQDESTRQELLKAVVERPDDDAPRLAYADWLDAHGEPERARFIRIQCQLVHLKEEERSLLERFSDEWARPIWGCGADEWKYHRGFPEEIAISAHHFLDVHERINRVTPIRRLRLDTFSDDDLARLATLPAATQLQSLQIGSLPSESDYVFGEDGLRTIATSPNFAGLRRLSLKSHKLGDSATTIVATSPVLQNLTQLELGSPFFEKNWIAEHEALIGRLPNLEELTLNRQTWDKTRDANAFKEIRRAESKDPRGRT